MRWSSQNKIGLKRFCSIALALSLALAMTWRASAHAAGPSAQQLAQGKLLYLSKCAVCHGSTGKGDGPAAYLVYPKPRDFTLGIFKIRSTMTLPTDDDLLRTITQGMPGTAMPSWAVLSEAERRSLVLYVKTLAPVFKGKRLEPIPVPEPPAETPELLAQGQQMFKDAGCIECHGTTGRGDGPSAPTLKDEWGYRIVPYDFTIPGRMKGGYTPRDLFQRLTVGVGGTPMPAYAESLDEKQRWAVAYYALSLAKGGAKTLLGQSSGTIASPYFAGELPQEPVDSTWAKAAPSSVRVQALWSSKATVSAIEVRSLHNDREVAFLLQWADDKPRQNVFRPQDFSDAVAIEFPLSLAVDRTLPSVVMGEPQRPVDIWYWKAQWELQAGKSDYDGLAATYPRLDVDYYPFQEATFLTGLGAGNPVSIRKRPTAVQHINAAGPGTITAQADTDRIRGKGVWSDGLWRVVLLRQLAPAGRQEAAFAAGASEPIAFAVWNGNSSDRDGQKSFSSWQRLIFERQR